MKKIIITAAVACLAATNVFGQTVRQATKAAEAARAATTGPIVLKGAKSLGNAAKAAKVEVYTGAVGATTKPTVDNKDLADELLSLTTNRDSQLKPDGILTATSMTCITSGGWGFQLTGLDTDNPSYFESSKHPIVINKINNKSISFSYLVDKTYRRFQLRFDTVVKHQNVDTSTYETLEGRWQTVPRNGLYTNIECTVNY